MKTIIIKIFVISLFVLFSCSENPVFKDKEITNNSITGTVELSDGSSPDSVFVWFRALDISTRTDEHGNFKLPIPSADLQPGKGLDGLYALYFYVANYNLDSLEIAMSNGSIQNTNAEVNSNGELSKHVKLQKLLEITASVEPLSITPDFQDTILTTLTLKAYTDNVLILADLSHKEFKWDPVFLAGFLVDSENKFVMFVKREERGLRTSVYNVGIYPVTLYKQRLMLKCEPGMLAPGEYKIVPYFNIQQDNLPKALIESLGNEVLTYSSSFLRIPIKINGNSFKVIG